MTIFSPWTVGTVLTRRSTRLSPVRSAMAPSWGMRFSAMSIFARILSREMIMMNDGLRRRGQLVEHAVDPQAELAAILERLEVDVAGAVAQRLLEDLVDHADDPAVGVRGGRGIEVEDVLVVVVSLVLGHVEAFGALADALGVLVGLDTGRRAATGRPRAGRSSD